MRNINFKMVAKFFLLTMIRGCNKIRNNNMKLKMLDTIFFVSIIIVCNFFFAGCKSKERSLPDALKVASSLHYLGYTEASRQGNQDSIWLYTKQGLVLRNIIFDSLTSYESKFIASQILFEKDSTFPNKNESKAIGKAYANMLCVPEYQFYFIKSDRGGFGGHNERENFISLGTSTIPYLYVLLNNNGSYSDSTLFRDNTPHVIKDIACSYICNILNFSYLHYSDSLQNNLFIDSVKQKIPEMLKINQAGTIIK